MGQIDFSLSLQCNYCHWPGLLSEYAICSKFIWHFSSCGSNKCLGSHADTLKPTFQPFLVLWTLASVCVRRPLCAVGIISKAYASLSFHLIFLKIYMDVPWGIPNKSTWLLFSICAFPLFLRNYFKSLLLSQFSSDLFETLH